jgi:hypothetical protein
MTMHPDTDEQVYARRARRIKEIEDSLARPAEEDGPEWWIRRGQLQRELERLVTVQNKFPC